MSLKDKFKISDEFMEPIITLFVRFELAIPLDKNSLLIPSLLQSKKVMFSGLSCKFPRKRIVSRDSVYSNFKFSNCFDVRSKSDSLRSTFGGDTGRGRSSTACMSTVVQTPIDKQIKLLYTRMCYRRVFGADHIPANFWPRLIARFLSSVESFQKIIRNNCVSNIHCENFVDGGACIGALRYEWSYGKNYVILSLGSDDILRVNGLYSFRNSNRREKFHNSKTVQKVECMQVYHGDTAGFRSINLNDGFEVTIPDYIIHSGVDPNNLEHQSEQMSPQILSHVLETIDEVLKDWFEGLLERGIYSDKYLTHFIPCPYCFGDAKPDDINEDTGSNSDDSDEPDESPSDEVFISPTNDGKPVGFSVQYCLSQARVSNYVDCPNHRDKGRLPLKYLAPDLVSSKTMLQWDLS